MRYMKEQGIRRKLSSHTSPTPENPEKSTYMLINGWTRHGDQMKDEKIKITSQGKTQFKGNLILHTNIQINDK